MVLLLPTRRERSFLNPSETVFWPMPPERSLDTLEEFEAAERLARG